MSKIDKIYKNYDHFFEKFCDLYGMLNRKCNHDVLKTKTKIFKKSLENNFYNYIELAYGSKEEKYTKRLKEYDKLYFDVKNFYNMIK